MSNNTIKFKVDTKTYIMREKEWKMLRMWEVEGYQGPYPIRQAQSKRI